MHVCWKRLEHKLSLSDQAIFSITKESLIRMGRPGAEGRYEGNSANLSRLRVELFATPWTLQSMEFSRLEYWSG